MGDGPLGLDGMVTAKALEAENHGSGWTCHPLH